MIPYVTTQDGETGRETKEFRQRTEQVASASQSWAHLGTGPPGSAGLDPQREAGARSRSAGCQPWHAGSCTGARGTPGRAGPTPAAGDQGAGRAASRECVCFSHPALSWCCFRKPPQQKAKVTKGMELGKQSLT